MSDTTVPRLAALYLATGHAIPADVLETLTAPATRADHPLDGWECPLDATRQYGTPAADGIRVAFPEH